MSSSTSLPDSVGVGFADDWSSRTVSGSYRPNSRREVTWISRGQRSEARLLACCPVECESVSGVTLRSGIGL